MNCQTENVIQKLKTLSCDQQGQEIGLSLNYINIHNKIFNNNDLFFRLLPISATKILFIVVGPY